MDETTLEFTNPELRPEMDENQGAERRLTLKICGITRLDDGLAALEAGADWLGFVRWERSPRYRSLEDLALLLMELRAQAPRRFEAVGVYVNATRATIEAEAMQVGLDRAQLHGDETPEFVRSLELPVIKALPIEGPESLARADAYEGIDLLTDAADPAQRGGTGQAYDYTLLRELAARRRVMVAGGLSIANVSVVVRELRPWGVDVSSAVERSPGVKDPDLVRRFVQAARAFEGML